MQNINSYRKFQRNDQPVNESGEYVLYWMQINRRFEYNYALEYAVAWANKLNKPILVYEGLTIDYPWASDRMHAFLMQGMQENQKIARQKGVNLFSYVEPKNEAGKGLFYRLAEKACCVISDEYPVFIIRKHNERVADRIKVPFSTIDSNGLIPLGITEKDPYSAYLFRKIMQKHFVEAYTNPPKIDALQGLSNTDSIQMDEDFLSDYTSALGENEDVTDIISTLDIEDRKSVV